jgi:Protein of unknown function (DUF1570)
MLESSASIRRDPAYTNPTRKRGRIGRFVSVAIVILLTLSPQIADCVDQVTLKRDGKETELSGKLLVTAKDGGILLLAPDGTLWNIEPQEIAGHKEDERPFTPLTQNEAGRKALGDLPVGFEIYTTSHYVICHNTSRAYAQWVGALYERLYLAFNSYWKNRGFKLHEPELPLLVLVFATHDGYTGHVRPELGDNAGSIIAFYSLRSNRVSMYDLTGVESLRRPGDKRGDPRQINQMLSRPDAETMVATIVHEATHQLAFNCGLQTRFADIPLWVLEGLAVYFETPDLSSSRGWKKIGEVNRPRLERFRDYLTRRPAKSLLSLISDDKRFRDPRQGVDAYAEAWALNYYLIQQKPKEFLAYMEVMAAKKTLLTGGPELRVKEFQAAFGNDLDRLDSDFIKYMQRIR